MLGDNIKILRKQKGYSQETLAGQLNVVRQTVSKWEKGISVPDAEMLSRIAELLEVSVEELLGNKIPENTASEENAENKEIVKQLAVLNEQLAMQNLSRRHVLKTVKIVLSVIIAASIAVIIFFAIGSSLLSFKSDHSTGVTTSVTLQCVLDDEEYIYEIIYDEQYRIIEAGGDAWIADHVQTEQYDDANILIAQIEDYFTGRGGSCKIIEDVP